MADGPRQAEQQDEREHAAGDQDHVLARDCKQVVQA